MGMVRYKQHNNLVVGLAFEIQDLPLGYYAIYTYSNDDMTGI